MKKLGGGKVTTLIVYVDDIIVTGNDLCEIGGLKKKLAAEFEIKEPRKPKYFLGIEVAYLKVVYKILRYLKGTPGKGILYNKGATLSFEAFIAANWAGLALDSRSTSGLTFFLGENFFSEKQKTAGSSKVKC